MATKPRVSSGIPGRPADLPNVLAHVPGLDALFQRLYGVFWSQGVLDARTKEVARIRNARMTNCGL